jgi:glycosyltransferase involved in cell wall biosynthesis
LRVLIINQFFYPDVAATAQLITDLVEDLADKNFKITVLTSRSNYLGGKLYAERNGKLFDAKVIRVKCTCFGKKSTIGRVLDYISFYFLALIRGLSLPKQDAVVVLTTPPLLSFIGLVLKKVKGSKYVCVVEDLYPETAIALGVLRSPSLPVKVINSISKKSYVSADSVIAISEKMKDRLIDHGAHEQKVVVVDNWADSNQIYPVLKEKNWFTQRHQLQNCFTVEYSGNMGLGHDFDTILSGVRELRNRKEVKFLFVGDGVQKDYILDFKQKHDLENLIYLPYQNRSALAHSISAGDVGLITLRPSLDGCIVPCKLYGIMAAARPVIFIGNADSDIARILDLAHCGYQVEENDIDGFLEKVDRLSHDPGLTETLGRNGYRYFLENFERRLATTKYYDVLMSVVHGQSEVISASFFGENSR